MLVPCVDLAPVGEPRNGVKEVKKAAHRLEDCSTPTETVHCIISVFDHAFPRVFVLRIYWGILDSTYRQ